MPLDIRAGGDIMAAGGASMQMPKETPKACFFDVFGTLVDWRTSIARETEAILKRGKIRSRLRRCRMSSLQNASRPLRISSIAG